MITYLSYRDEATCHGTAMKVGYLRETVAGYGQRIAKEGVLPAAFGFAEMHITYVRDTNDRGETLFVIAMTDHALDSGDRLLIAANGWKFLEREAA